MVLQRASRRFSVVEREENAPLVDPGGEIDDAGIIDRCGGEGAVARMVGRDDQVFSQLFQPVLIVVVASVYQGSGRILSPDCDAGAVRGLRGRRRVAPQLVRDDHLYCVEQKVFFEIEPGCLCHPGQNFSQTVRVIPVKISRRQ